VQGQQNFGERQGGAHCVKLLNKLQKAGICNGMWKISVCTGRSATAGSFFSTRFYVALL
jgi:hypothetical protein